MLRIATGQLGIGKRQISTVNASVAMSIRADKRAVALPRMLEKIETELATATGPEDHWAQRASRVDPRPARSAAISDLGEVLRGDRSQARGDGVTALGIRRTLRGGGEASCTRLAGSPNPS